MAKDESLSEPLLREDQAEDHFSGKVSHRRGSQISAHREQVRFVLEFNSIDLHPTCKSVQIKFLRMNIRDGIQNA